jgi:serine/threonine-protein kinase
MSTAAGDLAARVVVGEMLGKGGMAEVWAATDADGSPVALKVLSPALADRAALRLRFDNEVELLELCRGKYILNLIASGTYNGLPAYLAERCTGSLYDLGRDNLVPLHQVLRASAEILVALDRVHAAGAVHRDIKPANILVGSDRSIRLADFGIARHPVRRLTVGGQPVGTPSFSAPELVADPRSAHPSHDLYSLGLLILAMSTHLRTRTLVDPELRPRTLTRFPPGARHLLDRATHPDPGKRYVSAAEMQVDLQATLKATARA